MSTIKVNDIIEATSGGGKIFPPRAWVNFDGNGTVAIRSDGNVSSITDNDVGNYTTNLSNSLSSNNFCCNFSATDDGSGAYQTNGYAYGSWARGSTNVVYSTSSIRVGMGYPANTTLYDQSHVNISVVL